MKVSLINHFYNDAFTALFDHAIFLFCCVNLLKGSYDVAKKTTVFCVFSVMQCVYVVYG